ncbi:MAG: hypothetical protein LT080_08925 [Thiobacillus sp.]|nr:hypothetical protein [Thiobacillus sp.]
MNAPIPRKGDGVFLGNLRQSDQIKNRARKGVVFAPVPIGVPRISCLFTCFFPAFLSALLKEGSIQRLRIDVEVGMPPSALPCIDLYFGYLNAPAVPLPGVGRLHHPFAAIQRGLSLASGASGQ